MIRLITIYALRRRIEKREDFMESFDGIVYVEWMLVHIAIWCISEDMLFIVM